MDAYVDELGHDFGEYVADENTINDGLLTARCKRDGCNATDDKQKDGVMFKTLTVYGTSVYGKVSNATETFSFANEINVFGTAKFVVALDIYGSQIVATKTIPLTVGDNTAYIIETIDGEPANIYTVTVRRRPIYQVTFDPNGGSMDELNKTQAIEEDSLASEPSATKAGYTLDWEHNFATPITGNITIKATWNAIFEISENTITGLTEHGKTLGEISIPETIDGVSITAIKGFAFKNDTTLTNVTIGNNMVSIGASAFYGCTSLKSIAIPKSVTSIGASAFYGCTSLNGVYITDIAAWCNILFKTASTNAETSNPLFYANNLYINNNLLTELIIPESVTSIGDYAFHGCSSLTSVTIPDSIASIGVSAFRGCSSLTSVTIPDCITSLGASAFRGCSSLTSITIPDSVTSIGASAFSGCSSLTSITIPDSVTSIGASAFSGCSSLTSVTIPDGVTSIGASAFSDCSSLTSVTIPNGVTSIDESTFSGCSSLTNVKIPDSVTYIGEKAFSGCTSLTSVMIGTGVTFIADFGFYNCNSLTGVYITDIAAWCNIVFENDDDYYESANPLLYANNLYLNNELVTELVIPDGVTSINAIAFIGCSSLTSVAIPNSVTSIGRGVFSRCTGLTSISLPFVGVTSKYGGYEPFGVLFGNNMPRGTKIEQYYFASGGWYLGEYSLPSDLTSVTVTGTEIHHYAFYGCSPLTNITISESINSIGEYAFSGCKGLTNVYITDIVDWCNIDYGDNLSGSNPLYYAKNLYLNNQLVTELVIPDSVTSIDGAFKGYTGLTSVIVGKGITSIGNYAFSGCSSLMSITIPGSVTSIGSFVFSNCSSLTSIIVNENNVFYKSLDGNLYSKDGKTFIQYAIGKSATVFTIPDGVTFIGYAAFSGCSSLTNITIPNSVTSIDVNAFSHCDGLTSVIIPDSVVSIEGNAFAYCNALTSVTIGNGVTSIGDYAFRECGNLTNVTLGKCVASIGEWSFWVCSKLTDIIIPESLTCIGEGAFSRSRITHITFEGTITQWNAVEKGDNWYYTATKVVCSDGDVVL